MRNTKKALTHKLADVVRARQENDGRKDKANDMRFECARFVDLHGAQLSLVMQLPFRYWKSMNDRNIAQEKLDLATLEEENAEQRYRMLREKGQRLLVRELVIRRRLERLCGRTSRRAGK